MDKHQQIERQLSAYFDRELEASEAILVEKHLQNCSECQQIMVDFEAQQSLISKLKQEDPIEVWSQIRDQIDLEKDIQPFWKQWGVSVPIVALTAMLVFSLIILYPISEESTTSPINDYLLAHAQYSTDYAIDSLDLDEAVSTIDNESFVNTDRLLDAYYGYE